MAKKNKEKKLSYICRTCAISLGGMWPEGHVATVTPGVCDNCGLSNGLAHVHDWQLDTGGQPYQPWSWEVD